jgi:hypothetical protein
MYNVRLQRITDQLERTQVGPVHRGLKHDPHLMPQLEKEALDDVAMDIELADDDKPILCVMVSYARRTVTHSAWKQVPHRRSIRPPAVGKGPRETCLRSGKSTSGACTASGCSRRVQNWNAGPQSPSVFQIRHLDQSRLSKARAVHYCDIGHTTSGVRP